METLRLAFDANLKPIIRALGGDIELLDMTSDGWVIVRLSVTGGVDNDDYLDWIRASELCLKRLLPEVRGVIPAIVAWLPELKIQQEQALT